MHWLKVSSFTVSVDTRLQYLIASKSMIGPYIAGPVSWP